MNAADLDSELAFHLTAHSFGTLSIGLSPSAPHCLDIALLEGITLAVSLSLKGYSLLSYHPPANPGPSSGPSPAFFETLNQVQLRHYETLDALLHAASPLYSKAFQGSLFAKLSMLKAEQEREEEDQDHDQGEEQRDHQDGGGEKRRQGDGNDSGR